MRRAALLAPWALLVITLDVARGQFGPDAMRESVPFRVSSDLIDDTHLAGGEEIAPAPGRFVVIVLRGEAVLVDTASGATWRLVFGAADEVPLRWAPIPRERAEPRRRIRRRVREPEQSGALPHGSAVLVSAAAEPMPTSVSPEEETTPSDDDVERASAACVEESPASPAAPPGEEFRGFPLLRWFIEFKQTFGDVFAEVVGASMPWLFFMDAVHAQVILDVAELPKTLHLRPKAELDAEFDADLSAEMRAALHEHFAGAMAVLERVFAESRARVEVDADSYRVRLIAVNASVEPAPPAALAAAADDPQVEPRLAVASDEMLRVDSFQVSIRREDMGDDLPAYLTDHLHLAPLFELPEFPRQPAGRRRPVATPEDRTVVVSHHLFQRPLREDGQLLVVEPQDIAQFAEMYKHLRITLWLTYEAARLTSAELAGDEEIVKITTIKRKLTLDDLRLEVVE